MAETHFIEFNTLSSGRKRRAACGVYADLSAHSAHPTCPDCQPLVAAADAADAALEARAEATGMTVEELLFGKADDPRDVEGSAPDCPQVPR